MNNDKWTNGKWTNDKWKNHKWTNDEWTMNKRRMNDKQTSNEQTMNDQRMIEWHIWTNKQTNNVPRMVNKQWTNNERTMNEWKNKTQGWIPQPSFPPEAAWTFGSTTPAWFPCLSLQVSPNQLANYTVGRIMSCRAALTRRNKCHKGQGHRLCSARHAMSTFASHAWNCTTSKGTLHHTLQQFWAKSSGQGSYIWLLGRF